MELDDVKALWQSHTQNLERRISLTAHVGRGVRSVRRGLITRLIVDAIAVLLIGSFAGDHAADWRYLLPALALEVFALAVLRDTILQTALLRGDCTEPVLQLQERLLRLRERRLRAWGWTLALSPLLWVPLSIVAVRAIAGVDVYTAFGAPYIAANTAFGFAALGAAWLIARRGGAWFERYPSVKLMLDDVSGRSLAQAVTSLDALRRLTSKDTAA